MAPALGRQPVRPLTSVLGWGVVRSANYRGAVGDPGRWPSPRQIYQAAGLSPLKGKLPEAGLQTDDYPAIDVFVDFHPSTWL